MKEHPRRWRGLTLVETLITAAVLILGIGVVASTVVSIVRLNRRNLAQAQAYTIAEWGLERITRMGCLSPDQPNPCAAIIAQDRTSETVYWSASGLPTTTAPADPALGRPYTMSYDVDPPMEGDEEGSPPLNRNVIIDSSTGLPIRLTNTVNVRVTVSWKDELSRDDYHAVALQTRVAP